MLNLFILNCSIVENSKKKFKLIELNAIMQVKKNNKKIFLITIKLVIYKNKE